MNVAKRVIYMFLGGVVALGLAFGAYSAFAQGDDANEETETPDSAGESTVEGAPFLRGERIGRDFGLDGEALAAALGITVEELQAARETAFEAALQQAVDEGVLSEAEAELLRERPGLRDRIPGIRGLAGAIDMNALLADALGITVEELDAARDEAQAIRLAEMVEEGVLTQEQADGIQAADAVRAYVDRDALRETIQSFFEDAIAQAETDGAITPEQGDLLRQRLEDGGPFRFDGPRGHRGPGHRGSGPAGGFAPFSGGNGA